MSDSLFDVGPDGICAPDRLAVVWPAAVPAARSAALADNGIEAGAFDAAVTVMAAAAGGAEWAALPPIGARLRRGPCPAGSVYGPAAQACSACFPSQYGSRFRESDSAIASFIMSSHHHDVQSCIGQ